MAQDTVENPVKMTDEVVKKLEEAFVIDATVEEACFYAGISKQTYYNWARSFPEQKERFDALRSNPVFKARKTLVEALSEPEMALKYLERKRKNEFSLRTETQDVSPNKTIIVINKPNEPKNEDRGGTSSDPIQPDTKPVQSAGAVDGQPNN